MKNKVQKVLFIGGAIFGLLVLYFLSLGPVLRLAAHTRLESFAEQFYSPLLDSSLLEPVVVPYLRAWDLLHPLVDTPIPEPKKS